MDPYNTDPTQLEYDIVPVHNLIRYRLIYRIKKGQEIFIITVGSIF